MRLRLASDAVHVYTPEGVYFRNNRGAYLLQGGKVACEFFRRLEPLLHDTLDLGEALAASSEAKRAEAMHIVGLLLERGYLVDPDGSPRVERRREALACRLCSDGREAVVYPATQCEECLLLRLRDLTPARGAFFDDALLRRYSEAFVEAGGCAPGEMVLIGGEGTSRHALAPHPLCSRCTALGNARRNRGLRAMAALSGIGSAPVSDTPGVPLLDAVEPLQDARFGPIYQIHERDFIQLPLTRSEVISVDGATVASGLDYFDSRQRALCGALTRYALRGVARDHELVDGHGWSVSMPAIEVALAPGAGASVACGASYEELFVAAVMAEEQRLTTCAIEEGTAALIEIDRAVPARHGRILDRYGVVPRLAVPSEARLVPVVIASAGSHRAVAAAPTLDGAVSEALLGLIAAIQAEDHGEAMDDPPLVAPLAGRTLAATLLQRMELGGRSGVLVPYLDVPLKGRRFLAGSFRFTPGVQQRDVVTAGEGIVDAR